MASTGSGTKRMVLNTRERIVSDDHNRLQAFGAQQLAEVLRYALDGVNEQDLDSGSLVTLGSGNETPLRGTIINGLRGRPEIGTVNLFVASGAALLVDNSSAGTDDSIASLVVDPGVTIAGQLTLTPGAGSTRIDVLECQRADLVLESDNRDVFNPATGLFSAVQVDKVVQGQLVYRLRLGTPGSGYPGNVAGWLPLMVASVPAGATTWDQVTCWDVRPLASDRANGLVRTKRVNPWLRRSSVMTDTTVGGSMRLYGEVDGEFNGYKSGGYLRKSDAAPYIDLLDATNAVPGFAGYGGSGKYWYLYGVFPFGLPRWVRYSDAPSGARKPQGMRGIPTISDQVPNYDGTPAAGTLQSPTTYGLGDPAGQNAHVLVAGVGFSTGGSGPLGVVVSGSDSRAIVYSPDNAGLAATSVSGTSVVWTLKKSNAGAGVAGPTGLPGNCRAARVRIRAKVVTDGVTLAYMLYRHVTASTNQGGHASASPIAAQAIPNEAGLYLQPGNVVVNYLVEFTAIVPLVQDPTLAYGGGDGGLGTFTVVWNISGPNSDGAPAFPGGWSLLPPVGGGNPLLIVEGWDLGP